MHLEEPLVRAPEYSDHLLCRMLLLHRLFEVFDFRLSFFDAIMAHNCLRVKQAKSGLCRSKLRAEFLLPRCVLPFCDQLLGMLELDQKLVPFDAQESTAACQSICPSARAIQSVDQGRHQKELARL